VQEVRDRTQWKIDKHLLIAGSIACVFIGIVTSCLLKSLKCAYQSILSLEEKQQVLQEQNFHLASAYT